MPSGKDTSNASSKGSGRSAKESGEPSTSAGSGKKPSRSGAEAKPVRHSVRTGGISPMQKPKPAAAPEKPTTVCTPARPIGSSGTSTGCGGSGAATRKKETPGTGAVPTPSLTSPKVPQTPPLTKPEKASSKPPPAGTCCSENEEVPVALQRSMTTPHGALVRVIDAGATAKQGTRKTMEDQHVMLDENIPFFGVYDGHGGTQCAEYLRENLHTLIRSHPEIKTNPEKAITDSIVKADADFLLRSEEESNESGSVCAVALILDDSLVVGNVGDCEAVLCRSGAPIVLTVKHTLQSNPSEVERVKEAGGRVIHNRVGHPKFNPSLVSLAVTRAIGDAGFKLDEYTDGKRSGIIAVPDTKTIKLVPEDEFFIIGCDGLWDVMSYEEVVDFCGRRFHSGVVAQSITDELAQAALNRGGTDNVTAVLVHLTRRGGPSGHEVFPETAVSTSIRNLSDEA